MGAGASASEVVGEYEEQSVEDAQKAYDDKKEEFGALPADEQGRIRNALASKYVKEAFKGMVQWFSDYLEKLPLEGETPTPDPSVPAETQGKYEKCFTSAFKLFDKDDGGTLSGDEAKGAFDVLACNASEMQVLLMKKMTALTMKKILEELKKSKEGAAWSDEDVAVFKESLDKSVAEEEERVAKELQSYKDNKEARDAAAFSVCDTSGDGTLCLKEYLAVCGPEGELHERFVEAMFPQAPEPPEE